MAKASTSFVSEQSVALAVTVQAIELLADVAENVLPLFYYPSREGGLQGRKSDPGAAIRAIAVFARRPKIDVVGQPTLQVKFNEVILHWADALEKIGVPTFAVTPRVTDLFSLAKAPSLAWFRLPATAATGDQFAEVEAATGHVVSLTSPTIEAYDAAAFVAAVAGAPAWAWSDLCEALADARESVKATGAYGSLFGPTMYRPMLFLHW